MKLVFASLGVKLQIQFLPARQFLCRVQRDLLYGYIIYRELLVFCPFLFNIHLNVDKLVDFDPPCGRLSYTRDELLQLRSHDVILPRPTRKAIFRHGLWLPRYYRISQSLPAERKQSTDQLIGTATTRPSPRSTVKFGLLNARSIGQKAANVASVICEELYDVFLITETWHTAREDASLSRCVPDGFVCIDQPRPASSDSSSSTNHG